MVSEENKIDPKHQQIRPVLRVIGPLVLIVGVIFLALGVIGFFSGFYSHSFGPPPFLWCPFVGLPLIFIGGVMTSAGYAGAVARYQAGEAAPVVKDTFNYLANGTGDGVRTIAKALREGMTGNNVSPTVLHCEECRTENPPDAKFCKHCGRPFVREKNCPHCNHKNDPDAKFCDNCGRSCES